MSTLRHDGHISHKGHKKGENTLIFKQNKDHGAITQKATRGVSISSFYSASPLCPQWLIVFSGFLLLALLCISPVVAVASNDLQELSLDERQKIIEKFKELQKNIHSISALIKQEKHLAVLKKKVLTEGTLAMAKPNMLRWEIVKPEKSITVTDGGAMTVYHPDIKEAQVYSISENLMARNAMSFFPIAMNGSLFDLEKKFSASIFRRDGEIVYILIPLSKAAGRYMSSVTIYYDEATGLPRGFDMTTPKGDTTVTKLTDVRTNPELRPEMFNIKLPADVWITNKFEHNNN
jgi:outer membrane lipoprotein-sorting protein